MADYARAHNLALRPHTKTHKSTLLAKMQMDLGAAGLTVAKTGEAAVMAKVADDILMAYPAVDPNRCADLANLARTKTIRVGLDSAVAVDALSAAARSAGSTIGILVDLDVGFGRTGVETAEDALALAQHISRAAGLRLDGLMFFPGQLAKSPVGHEAVLAEIDAKLAETIELWSKKGLRAAVVSGGSTPTAYSSHLIKHMTEFRPGTYIFNDMNTVHGGFCTIDDCAARIIATVVSDAVPGQVVIDAGSKTLTSDRCGPMPESGHGYVVEYPAAKIAKLSEEHGQVDMSVCASRPRVGQRVTVIPNHICPCVNLQDAFWWQENGEAPRAIVVEARGKVS
jgi:D-serine deaminase-like pyridoxal phosphate-dependent protein